MGKKKKNYILVLILLIGIVIITTIFSKYFNSATRKEIKLSSTNIETLNLKEEFQNIKNELNIKNEVKLDSINIEYTNDEEITLMSTFFIDEKDVDIKYFYSLYYNKEKFKDNLIIEKIKNKNFYNDNKLLEISSFNLCEEFLNKFNLVKNEKPLNIYEEYSLYASGNMVRYKLRSGKAIVMGKNNNVRELTDEKEAVDGDFINITGTKRDGKSVNTAAPIEKTYGSVDIIIQ